MAAHCPSTWWHKIALIHPPWSLLSLSPQHASQPHISFFTQEKWWSEAPLSTLWHTICLIRPSWAPPPLSLPPFLALAPGPTCSGGAWDRPGSRGSCCPSFPLRTSATTALKTSSSGWWGQQLFFLSLYVVHRFHFLSIYTRFLFYSLAISR